MAQRKTDWKARFERLVAQTGLSSYRTAIIVGLLVFCTTLIIIAVIIFWPKSNAGSLQVAIGSDALSKVSSTSNLPAEDSADEAISNRESKGNNESQRTILVDVEGAVMSPGVYELSLDSRAHQAIEAAGGFCEDAQRAHVNLARILIDGEQIYVPRIDEASARPAGVGGANAYYGAASSELVNINTADQDALQTLPGVGEATARKIITDRESNGPFSSIEEICRISGIGEKRFEELKDLICV